MSMFSNVQGVRVRMTCFVLFSTKHSLGKVFLRYFLKDFEEEMFIFRTFTMLNADWQTVPAPPRSNDASVEGFKQLFLEEDQSRQSLVVTVCVHRRSFETASKSVITVNSNVDSVFIKTAFIK